MWLRIYRLRKFCSTDEFSKTNVTKQLYDIVKGLVAASKICSRTNHVEYQNESFNRNTMISWERIPKTSYVSLSQLQLGVFDVVANFNVGRGTSILI